MNFKKSIIVFYVLTTLLISSCKEKKDAVELKLEKYWLMDFEPDNSIVYLSLLHAYPDKCNSGLQCANLYVCQRLDNKDSMFVFDISDRQGDFIFEKKSEKQGLFINKQNVQHWNKNSVIVNIPTGFKIPAKIEYIFATISEETE